MNVVYYTLVGIAVLVAIIFSLLVLLTGKGDAMNGGGSVRTTFKGKASFDDIMSRWTLIIGASFMGLVLIIDIVAKRLDTTPVIDRSVSINAPADAPVAPPVTPVPSNAPANIPSSTPPATNGTSNAPVGNAPVGNAPSITDTTPTTNGPLNSTPATVPDAANAPSVVPSVPGATNSGAANTGATNTGN